MRMMLFVLGLIATTAVAQEAPVAGVWTAIEAERNGAPAPDVIGHRLTFEGGDFRIVKADGTLVYAGSFRVDPAAEPPAIDFVNVEGQAAGVTWAGIWQSDDHGLTIVDNAPDPDRPRPTSFAAPTGSGYILLVFERND
jgi:uncharacterized protein (TIGR03067 family)